MLFQTDKQLEKCPKYLVIALLLHIFQYLLKKEKMYQLFCARVLAWTTWTFTSCTASCETGTQAFSRTCLDADGNPAPDSECEAAGGTSTETRDCNTFSCPGG